MPVRILATADIHIGRRSTRISDTLDDRRFSCAHAWQSLVELAVREKVDAVAVSGDVVDQNNRFFEAIGPLESGIKRLTDNQIATFFVAGNHDYDVLQRLAESIDSELFFFLGKGGKWEDVVLHQDGKRVLRFVGWSFPSRYVETSPIASLPSPLPSDLPIVGLLHADLDAVGSKYAPVMLSEFENTDVGTWILGHVHRPQQLKTSSGIPVFYPGSPQAMDPGETGIHGPSLIEIDDNLRVQTNQIGLSSVCYDEVTIDVSQIEDADDLESHIHRELADHLEELCSHSSALEYVSIRIRFGGRTRLKQSLEALGPLLIEQFERVIGKAICRVEKVTDDSHLWIDIEQLAKNHDPPGLLAQAILAIESGQFDAQLDSFLHVVQSKQSEVFHSSTYSALNREDESPPNMEWTRQSLVREGRRLLDRMLQSEASS